MEQVPLDSPVKPGAPMIFTDARASDNDACLGGFLDVSRDRKKCPWFSVMVDEKLAPWLFVKGGSPKRVIAALELLATLLAVKIWTKKGQAGVTAMMKAYTDNRGNSFALKKGMSTRFPLTLLLMELAEEMREKDLRVDLEWISRDRNTEADDLSNGNWAAFDEKMRVEVEAEKVEWKVLGDLMKRSEDLYCEITKLKEEKKQEKLSRKAPRAAGGKKPLPKW